jgi:hypothetical protein
LTGHKLDLLTSKGLDKVPVPVKVPVPILQNWDEPQQNQQDIDTVNRKISIVSQGIYVFLYRYNNSKRILYFWEAFLENFRLKMLTIEAEVVPVS